MLKIFLFMSPSTILVSSFSNRLQKKWFGVITRAEQSIPRGHTIVYTVIYLMTEEDHIHLPD